MTPPPPAAEPTPLEIALLAARLLPPMELPANWATEHHLILQPILTEATTGKGRNFAPGYEYPAGWPTPFEVVAEEATRRARILLDIAAGRIRPERTASKLAGDKASQQMQQYAHATASMDLKFERHAKGKSSLPIMEALKIALPRVYKHNSENAYRYWREYLRTSVQVYRSKHGLPEIPVIFLDEITERDASLAVDQDSREGPPHHVALSHNLSYQVTRSEFGTLAVHVQQYCESPEGLGLKRLLAAEAGKRGGKKSQQNIRQEGKVSPRTGRKLDIAAKKVKKRASVS